MRAEARRPSRVREQQEREQAERLALVRHEPREQPGEPDRLLAEIAADRLGALGRRVALGVDEGDDAEHAVQALGEQLVGWYAEGDAGVGDLPARAGEAPLHGGLARQERARDLGDREAADAAQGQCHPRLGGQRGVAAREDHPQPVVLQRGAVELQLHDIRLLLHELGRVGGGDALVAQPVQRAAPRRRGQPRAGALRHAAAVPVDRRGHERVLHDVLRERQVAAEAVRDRREDRRTLGAERLLQDAGGVGHANS